MKRTRKRQRLLIRNHQIDCDIEDSPYRPNCNRMKNHHVSNSSSVGFDCCFLSIWNRKNTISVKRAISFHSKLWSLFWWNHCFLVWWNADHELKWAQEYTHNRCWSGWFYPPEAWWSVNGICFWTNLSIWVPSQSQFVIIWSSSSCRGWERGSRGRRLERGRNWIERTPGKWRRVKESRDCGNHRLKKKWIH